MSNRKTGPANRPARPAITPLIGSLLRLPHEVCMARMLATLESHGFDITPTELGVFLYPSPEGRRPVDLARQCHMSRQAMNYVLSGLERRGYLERHAGTGTAKTVIRMTAKGWSMVEPIRKCIREIEQEWTKHLGVRRFEALRGTLHELALRLGKLD
jgi:DNA-binding MarR family transcriptional regulator